MLPASAKFTSFFSSITLIKPFANKLHLLCVHFSGPQRVPSAVGLIKQNVIVKYFTAKRKQTYKIYS